MVNLKQAKGITLIALVITIIVLLILAGTSISMLTEENGIITKASESEFKAELSKIKEDFDLYVTSKYIENSSFEQGTLNAGKSILTYNTMPEGEKGNIYTVLANSSEKYIDSFEVIKGELIYSSQNSTYLKWALEMGLKINPYLIVDGELLSSETNLMLMDENSGTIVIPETVTKIGDGAFRDVKGLKTIIIPGAVKEIGNYAFSGNPTLENVIIEEGVEKIGDFAFEDCTALKTIHIANSVSSIGSTCFGGCTALTDINFPTSLTVVPYRMLSRCSSLTKIILPEGIVSISGNAFSLCSNLSYISIPSTVTSIDGSAFLSDYKLIDIDISSNNKNYSFINSCLMSADEKTLYYVISNTTQINIPNSVEIIQTGSLEKYGQKATLNISKNVKTISTTFSSNIISINVVEDNPYFKSDNGDLYNKNLTTLYKYTQNKTSFTLPDTIKEIKAYAFNGESNLTQVTLPESLEIMGAFVFTSTKISNLYIPKNVTGLQTNAFSDNITVTISSENPNYKTDDGTIILSKDGKTILAVSKNLESYNIPNSVETIGNSAFYNRNKLKEIVIPSNVKTIQRSAFDYSTNLQKVKISSSIESIDSSAFTRCNSLTEIIIDKAENEVSGSPWGCPYGLRAVKWQY